MRSAKVDGVRVAVASLLGGVPALVESATALRRDVARAGGQRSSLLAARVGRDAAALALGGSVSCP